MLLSRNLLFPWEKVILSMSTDNLNPFSSVIVEALIFTRLLLSQIILSDCNLSNNTYHISESIHMYHFDNCRPVSGRGTEGV